MGCSAARARSSIRFSLGIYNTEQEVDYVLKNLPGIIAKLRAVLDEGNGAAKSRNVDDLVRLNGEFHDGLAEAGRNSILWDIMRTLRERTSLVFAANTARRAQQDWDEHSRILAAVIEGDEDLASMLAMRHVRRAAEAAFAAAVGKDAA